MVILKQNLDTLGVPDELIWTTFFDLYETLEGYVSHLIKVSFVTFRLFGIEWKFYTNQQRTLTSSLFTTFFQMKNSQSTRFKTTDSGSR